MRAKRTCSMQGCDKPHVGRGRCRSHYQEWRHSPAAVAIFGRCSAEGCPNPRFWKANPFCQIHHFRWTNTGRLDRKSIEERYEEKVDRSGGPDACHPWTAALGRNDMAIFGNPDGSFATRWAYQRFVGPLGPKEVVRHTCDWAPCQNRRRWVKGTQADNVYDMVERGRQHHPRGELNVKAKLTAAQVAEIRSRATGKYGEQRALAREYGVHPGSISNVLRGKTWS